MLWEGGVCSGSVSAKHKSRAVRVTRGGMATALLIGFGAAVLLGAESIGKYFNEGIRLAVERVLPSAFPFMVLSSLVSAMIDPTSMPTVSRAFQRVFSVSGAGLGAFIIGSLAGFPVGAKLTSELYCDGLLSRSDAERLMAYSCSPSAPFAVAVVGGGMLGDKALGIILLLSVWIGNVLCAQLFRGKCGNISIRVEKTRQKPSFVEAVKSATSSSIYMAAFVSFFYIVSSAAKIGLRNRLIRSAFIMALEVSGAMLFISEEIGNLYLTMSFSALALGFGGLSVMAQVYAVTDGSGLRMRKYFYIKIFSALFSAILAPLITAIYAAIFG